MSAVIQQLKCNTMTLDALKPKFCVKNSVLFAFAIQSRSIFRHVLINCAVNYSHNGINNGTHMALFIGSVRDL